MDVSPQLLREIEFGEQWRGYSKDDVDDFLERLAVALEQVQERLRDATDRAGRAERTLVDRSDDDEIRRTLVLAQRTADAALDEARTEAERIVSEAEQRASAQEAAVEERAARREAEAEERASSLHAEVDARVSEELGALASTRSALEGDIVALTSHRDAQLARLRAELEQQLAWIDAPDRESTPLPALSEVSVPAVSELGLVQRGDGAGGDDVDPSDDDEAQVVAEVLEDLDLEDDDDGDDLVDDEDDRLEDDRLEDDRLDDDDAGHEDVAVGASTTDGALRAVPADEATDDLADDEEDRPVRLVSATTSTNGTSADHTEVFDVLAETPDLEDDDDLVPVEDERQEVEAEMEVDVREPSSGPLVPDDDDPFLAELRRAVNDTEPLGPRDDDHVPLYDQDVAVPAPRGRRRRRR